MIRSPKPDGEPLERGKPESVKTAARTLNLFETFAEEQAPLSLTDLAKRIDAPVSSCHALIRTLQALGYVYVLEQKKRVYPTKRLLQVAQAIASHDPLLESVSPILHQLRDALGETVILGKRQGQGIVYLEVIEGTHTVRYAARPGDAKPLHSSAIGKAMLGQESPSKLQALIGQLALTAATQRTLTDPGQLLDDIVECRKEGIFTTRGENVDDVMAFAIARPVYGETLGIAIAGPMERMVRHQERYRVTLLNHGDHLLTL
jgi:DNA-binding IclR family transcriptional regulator